MKTWVRRWRVELAVGMAVWGLLLLGGGVYARLAARPVWPTVVTWDEWLAAVLLIPQAAVWSMNTISRAKREADMRAALGIKIDPVQAPKVLSERLCLVALAVFGLDLVARAVLGLGWKPF